MTKEQINEVIIYLDLKSELVKRKSIDEDLLLIKQKEAIHDYGMDDYETTEVSYFNGRVSAYESIINMIQNRIEVIRQDKAHG